MLQTSPAPPPVPVGIIKTFGPFGPKYEVCEPVEQLEDGDWLVEIVLVETGEKAVYRRTHILDASEAH